MWWHVYNHLLFYPQHCFVGLPLVPGCQHSGLSFLVVIVMVAIHCVHWKGMANMCVDKKYKNINQK